MVIGKPLARSNFERFTGGSIYYFKFIGIGLGEMSNCREKFIQYCIILSYMGMLVHQICFFSFVEASSAEFSSNASFVNYFVVALGKYMAVVYNRRAMIKSHNAFKDYYPTTGIERRYNLERHLKLYSLVETLLSNFCFYIVILYSIWPIGFGLYDFFRTGAFHIRLPMPLWYPWQDSVIGFIFYYAFEVAVSIPTALTILSSDLWLYANLAQLSMYFDLTAQRILKLKPQHNGTSLRQLKLIIKTHRRTVKLANDVNNIFTPSIVFSLTSSSCILCFTAYQLLGDVSLLFAIKMAVLLLYESKQVVITCYYGNQLMTSSENVFDVIYIHDWHLGSIEYQRLVLQFMTFTTKPVRLVVAGVTTISLITLKEVFSMSYQIFTVLKTA